MRKEKILEKKWEDFFIKDLAKLYKYIDENSEISSDTQIAIVSVACQFPDASSPEAFFDKRSWESATLQCFGDSI